MSRTQNRFGDRLLMALVFLFLYAPIIILIVFSFNAGTSSSVWKGFSLKWYESLLSNRLIMNSVYTTLLVSLLSTIVASIAGTFAAIGLYAMSRRDVYKRQAMPLSSPGILECLRLAGSRWV